jgi:hypothetical protein
MKITKTVEASICDFCGTDRSVFFHCCACGKDACWDCHNKVGVEYKHGVYCGGSGDGYYCHDCDATDKSPLHSAYQGIRSLRLEEQDFYQDFRKRVNEAESLMKGLLERAVQQGKGGD